jgi:hypothetical protein
MRANHTFKMLQNKLLKRIYGSKKEHRAGSWRKLHNVYSESSILDEMGGACSTYEMRNAEAVLDGKPVGELPF